MAHISGRALPSHVSAVPPQANNRSACCHALQRTQPSQHSAAQPHRFLQCLTARHDARTPRHTPLRAKRRIEDDEDDILDDDVEEDDFVDMEEDEDEEEDNDLEEALDDGEPDDEVGDAFRRQRRGRVDLGDDDADLAQLLEDDDLDALEDEDDLPKQRAPRAAPPAPASPWLQAFVEEDEDDDSQEVVCREEE